MHSSLQLVPTRSLGAAENMALDASLLRTAGSSQQAFLRFYKWNEAALTFGFSQPYHVVRERTPDFPGTRIRRMTGGGIVLHCHQPESIQSPPRTYSLSIPASHPAAQQSASSFYNQLHLALLTALQSIGIRAHLQPCERSCGQSSPSLAAACFDRAEPFDLVVAPNGWKRAGAALKRNREGLLAQGSIEFDHAELPLAKALPEAFTHTCSVWLKAAPSVQACPPLLDLAECRKFASLAWNSRR